MPSESNEFYVGYVPKAPTGIGRAARQRALWLLGVATLAGVILALAQRPADPGVFEYGEPQAVFGQIRAHPYPMLLAPGGSRSNRAAIYTRYLLVGEGKHGAQADLDSLDGQWVELTGTRIARGTREMLELAGHEVHVITPAPNVRLGIPVPAPISLGRMSLTGEVVDSKCWLGVMKPATGSVHRGCATRCLSGGIPPLLMVQNAAGETVHLLLVGHDGGPALSRFLPLVGQDVTLTGEVIEEGDLLVLRVATIDR